MSLYIPTAVAATDLAIVEAPYFGGEFAVYLSSVLAKSIGEIDWSAAGVATYVDDPRTALATAGESLQVALINPLFTDVTTQVIVVGTDSSSAVASGVATFAAPSYALNTGKEFQAGYATDVVPVDTTDNLFKTITSVTVVGGSRGVKAQIVTLPSITNDYVLVGCSTDKDFTTKARESKPIACGMNGSAFAKGGRSTVGTLTVNTKLFGFGDGLVRYNGKRCTAMLVGLKEDLVIQDRIVFTSYWPTVKPRIPDGDAEAMLEGTGNYIDVFYFCAP